MSSASSIDHYLLLWYQERRLACCINIRVRKEKERKFKQAVKTTPYIRVTVRTFRQGKGISTDLLAGCPAIICLFGSVSDPQLLSQLGHTCDEFDAYVLQTAQIAVAPGSATQPGLASVYGHPGTCHVLAFPGAPGETLAARFWSRRPTLHVQGTLLWRCYFLR